MKTRLPLRSLFPVPISATLAIFFSAASATEPLPPQAGRPLDEAMGGKTLHGSPVTKRTPEQFPAETRDLFWEMDLVASSPGGPLQPLNFDTNGDGGIDEEERKAIQGRNTWILWGGGNEAFWGWLQEEGFGLVDFMVMLDSRQRGARFDNLGLINQPGMTSNREKLLGLYLDKAAGERKPLPEWLAKFKAQPVYPDYGTSIALTQPALDIDKLGHLAERKKTDPDPGDLFPTDGVKVPVWNSDGTIKVVDNVEQYQALADYVKSVLQALPKDGVDYKIYGYPSGVVGMRLFPNPDFFSNTKAADQARNHWYERVVRTNDRFYTDPAINADPTLIRPFRVAVSCGFCHVGPHPLSPAADRNNPEWYNLSSTIGAQYWRPQRVFGNLLQPKNFLHHFLNSQQPGTVDTSLVSTDQINNANTMNAVFEIGARLARAGGTALGVPNQQSNPTETQSAANLRLMSVEERDQNAPERHTPRVLVDGSDSIGAFGALARVYLNIGTFWEDWKLRHNAIIGFTRQKPFELETCQSNSVYWQTNERYRAPYLAKFFTLNYKPFTPHVNKPATGLYYGPTPTGPMKLRDAKGPDGEKQNAAVQEEHTKTTPAARINGRKAWLNHCAICHSSKQPDGFALTFAPKSEWSKAPIPKPNGTDLAPYVLPLDAGDWEDFKKSAAYQDYLKRLYALVASEGAKDNPAADLDHDDPWDKDHPFWRDNFLSTDIRVPVSLVGTNASRALATNALDGQIWDNFSSVTYKHLPASGPIQVYNPFKSSEAGKTTYDTYQPEGKGRGYYRPATHIALWATAPFLHNNALGVFTGDTSVKGRLHAFHDAINRMLWVDRRSAPPEELDDGKHTIPAHDGDLRPAKSRAVDYDPGFIYRLPVDTRIQFAAAFIRPIILGVVGPVLTKVLEFWLWVILLLVFVAAAIAGRPRYAGIVFLLLAVGAALGIFYSGMSGTGGSTAGALLMGISDLLQFSATSWWLLAAGFAAIGITLVFVREDCHAAGRFILAGLGLAAAVIVYVVSGSVKLSILTLVVGALLAVLWKGQLHTFSRALFAILALATAAGGWTANRFINGRVILHIPVANINIGPVPIDAGPIPRGTPVNLLMSMDPESPEVPRALASLFIALAEINQRGLTGEDAWNVISKRAGADLFKASKCPDYVLDKGHLFGEALNEDEKRDLIAFLETL